MRLEAAATTQTYPHKDSSTSESGFSLLEMLVVLAIMSMLVTLVSPSLISNISSIRFQKTAEASVKELKQFRVRAIIEGKGYVFKSRDTKRDDIISLEQQYFNVPANWSVVGETVKILPSGVCLGGEVTFLDNKSRQVTYFIEDFTCSSRRITRPNPQSSAKPNLTVPN